MYLNDIYTVTANLSGVPGISVPCGLSSEGLPIGMQLLGPYWSESNLFRAAHAYETNSPFTARPRINAD
jgi:aspartyl-tRNA(Asn)/glutamyl-tRNA(Gln) amidotransferase subunit A